MHLRRITVVFALLGESCSTMVPNAGKWPARTYDPELQTKDPKHVLRHSDIVAIHNIAWEEDAHRRVFSIRAVDDHTVLVICTDRPGDRLTSSEAFDLIRTGNGWKHGTYRSRNVVQTY